MKFKKICSVFLLSALILTGCSKPSNDESANKESNNNVKVVSATVAATQVLDKLDATLVGIPTTKSELPEKYKNLPEVGQAMNPDLEIVASLEPDVFIVDSIFKENVEKSMKEYNLDTFYFETGTYTKFLKSIENLGNKINKQDEAEKLIKELKGVEESVVEKSKKQDKKPRVAILFGGGNNFMLATKSSYLGDLVKTVGAENIADNLTDSVDSDYIQFSLEQIIKENPDYILRFAHGNIEETKKAFDDSFDKNPAWDTLSAVKNGKVIDLDSSIFNVSANIHVKDSINKLGDILYGDK
ncbi:ABC transporter substrate-binding protein [Clostridioides sp. ZZV14-6154]|uniref:ABC transporter substrate-binding protein n=1 Tax=Clostridioides sp. ZZV14-6154 TaxID=2811495 RepID=UPI001D1062D1|nr:ABC transporter substrate-binding protein [Clostridioides sp. ZZV14-6154]